MGANISSDEMHQGRIRCVSETYLFLTDRSDVAHLLRRHGMMI
jgi:hypothetical protein